MSSLQVSMLSRVRNGGFSALVPGKLVEYHPLVRVSGLTIPGVEPTFCGMTEFRIEDLDGNRLWIGHESPNRDSGYWPHGVHRTVTSTFDGASTWTSDIEVAGQKASQPMHVAVSRKQHVNVVSGSAGL